MKRWWYRKSLFTNEEIRRNSEYSWAKSPQVSFTHLALAFNIFGKCDNILCSASDYVILHHLNNKYITTYSCHYFKYILFHVCLYSKYIICLKLLGHHKFPPKRKMVKIPFDQEIL